jgi:hypothetical protein
MVVFRAGPITATTATDLKCSVFETRFMHTWTNPPGSDHQGFLLVGVHITVFDVLNEESTSMIFLYKFFKVKKK